MLYIKKDSLVGSYNFYSTSEVYFRSVWHSSVIYIDFLKYKTNLVFTDINGMFSCILLNHISID